ncbi:MAG TPA: valine--tRNA ligase [Flavobacteriaceae bacterium]|nr:valine--tRNA ligase [Flavobacteriaceae bacterium]
MANNTKYNSKEVEQKWYKYWMDQGYFRSTVDEREPYTIVIPPPNVTGVLHMGHMLNNTIQDVLIRRARLKGYNACWVPGTDHASIATEAKVVEMLAKKGIKKSDLTREEFLEHAWEWTHKHGGIILDQLKHLGSSCDWDRTKFTLDEDMSASVIRVFVDWYEQGYIYRGHRMINWDPEAKTTLSDEEVYHENEKGKLYHINYQIEGTEDNLTIATTRPETILGDTGICVHPEDERYQHLKGKRAIVPIANRSIPIVQDEYVDLEFGTGCLKVTPAHDENDKVLGETHDLEVIDILNDDGTLNEHGLHYEGKDRFVVRKELVEELQKLGLIDKIEEIDHSVGKSERTGAVIEPRLSEQWFVRMEELAKPALEAVLEEEVNLVPKKFVNTYRHWMENVRDWNISRQLWWGQRIPAYYYGDNEEYVIAETAEKALEKAREKSGNSALELKDLRQEEDVLDTWFSSAIWPISVFNGILEPDNEEINYYYPTNDIVTAPEILFFWIARMIVAGYSFRDEKPFSNVYLTGIVRDNQRRKMSKSLGNSPEPLDLIEEYGADGVRVGMLLSSPAGNDLMFDEELCKQGSAFVNKIWNAYRLVSGWKIDDESIDGTYEEIADLSIRWYENQFQSVLQKIESHFETYRISNALMDTYKLIWDDFCSWFLEMVKPSFGATMSSATHKRVVDLFEDNLRILHPFIPFATEEIWHLLGDRTPEEALIISTWPEAKSVDKELKNNFKHMSEVVTAIRSIRKQHNISFRDALSLTVVNHENTSKEFDIVLQKLMNLETITYSDSKLEDALTFRVKSNEYYIPREGAVDVEAELKKLESELEYQTGFLKSVQAKLSNERFVSKAPEQVVALERKKEADALAKIKTIENSIEALK